MRAPSAVRRCGLRSGCTSRFASRSGRIVGQNADAGLVGACDDIAFVVEKFHVSLSFSVSATGYAVGVAINRHTSGGDRCIQRSANGFHIWQHEALLSGKLLHQVPRG